MGFNTNSRPPSPSHRPFIDSNCQTYIFKLASLPTTTMPSLPIPSLSKSSSQSTSSSMPSQSALIHNGLPSTSPNNQSMTIYPLCMSGWCLSRLRTTCTLWAFVRSGIVEKVWEEEVITLPMPPRISSPSNSEKPPLPPRKRGLWSIASAIGERAASWSEGDKDKAKKPPLQEQRRLPLPPPYHPPIAAIPPPLPKRNEGRSRTPATHSSLPLTSIVSPTNTQTNPPVSTPVPSSSVSASLPVQEIPNAKAPSSDLTAIPASAIPDRVRTPSNIPLPDSRPSTPPVRTTSPAAIGSGGAPPPPVPKRAAARAVRGTVAASASASRPSTPVNGLESAVTHVPSTTENISIEPMPKNEEVKVDDKPNGDDNSNVRTEEPADATGNKIIEEVRSPSQSPPSDIFVDALSSKSEDVPATVELVQEKRAEDEEDNKTIIDVPVPITVELKPAVVSGPNNSDKAKTNGINHSNDNHVNGLVEPDLKALALEEKGEDNRKETEETDRRQYVGDGTWEEKTWKELVRLREDMFWARVGGFRG